MPGKVFDVAGPKTGSNTCPGSNFSIRQTHHRALLRCVFSVEADGGEEITILFSV